MDQFSTSQNIGEKKKPWWVKFAKVYALILLMIAFFIFGLATASVIKPPEGETSDKVVKETTEELFNIFSGRKDIDTDLFRQVWEVVHSEYFDKYNIDDKELFYGALYGMVDAVGDPHTIFLDPELTQEFNQDLDGTFFGIGAEIARKDGYLTVIAPLPGTPAEKAGLKAGDKILAIDDQETSDMSVDEAIYLIRGPKGEVVVLTVVSAEENSAKEISITRDQIEVPSVVYRNENGIAVVSITNFQNDTEEDFAKVVQNILKENPKGLILDLRNNPGGYLHVSVSIASYWLDPGQVVVRETFSDKRNDTDYEASNKPSLAHLNTVVLVNEGSASASEIVAGALQDYQTALIVGKQTFGKGSVQQLIPLKDDSSLKITVAKWLTPKGRTIDGEGITPDVEIDLTAEDYENDIDPQMQKAKDIILGVEKDTASED
ncbi:S41 family peptidase [Candidatus Parcubacteria bacterium]|nr:MAG: S41 family peptidase [Candidatus Parcubacteria bacterium]